MPRPTLDQSFPDGRPARGPNQHHSWLTAGERRFILWGLKEKWPAVRIATELKANEATVRRFRKRFWGDPGLILELGLYEMVGRARDAEYRCLVCEEKVVNQIEVQRHVLAHFLDDGTVDSHLLAPENGNGERGGSGPPVDLEE